MFERDVRLQQEREKGKADAAKRKVEQERVAIDESRRQQLQRQSQEKEADKKLGELYVKELARITAQQQDSEHKKKAAKRKQHSDLRKMQEQQIRENERRRAREKAEALKEEHQVRFWYFSVDCSHQYTLLTVHLYFYRVQVFHKLKKEDDIFKDFVTKEIESFKMQGKRTALLEKTLNRKS